jgi:hypothetical protein
MTLTKYTPPPGSAHVPVDLVHMYCTPMLLPVCGGGEGGYEPVHGGQELSQLQSHLLHQVQVEVGLVGLHPLAQAHHRPHHAGRTVVHRITRPVQVGRGGGLQLLHNTLSLSTC